LRLKYKEQFYNYDSKSYHPVSIGNNGNANKTITAINKCKKPLGSEKSSSCDIINAYKNNKNVFYLSISNFKINLM